MKQNELKSGITKEWLERAKGVSAATIGHEVWLDWTIVNKVDTIYKEKVPSTAA